MEPNDQAIATLPLLGAPATHLKSTDQSIPMFPLKKPEKIPPIPPRLFGAGWSNATIATTFVSPVWEVPNVEGIAATFNIIKMIFRLETAGTTTSQVTVEKSVGGNVAFVAVTVGTLSLTSGNHEISTIAALGSVMSSNLLRVTVNSAGTGAANFMVALEGVKAG